LGTRGDYKGSEEEEEAEAFPPLRFLCFLLFKNSSVQDRDEIFLPFQKRFANLPVSRWHKPSRK
jgi:hypothetical protein